MNTLIVVPWEHTGGVVAVAENLAGYLHARGHRVMFFHPGHNVLLRSRMTPLGLPGIQLRLTMPFAKPHPLLSAVAFPFLFPIILLQLISFLCKNRIEILNLHFALDNFIYFAICSRLLSIPLVTSVHGSDAFEVGKPRNNYSRSFRFLLRSSNLIVLPSQAYRKKLLTVFPDIEGKTIFIHNGINPSDFELTAGTPDASEHGRYILCIAYLGESKGIDVLLHAARPLLINDPTVKLIIAGEGALRRQLEGLSSSLGIAGQTQFIGTKGRTEIAQLLRGCEVFVLPSRAESFGIVVLEAMASRKPVVASSVGGVAEIIEHGKSGLLVAPDNPWALTEGLQRVLTDPDLKRTLAENGYSRVMQRFCFSSTGNAYEAAFGALSGLGGGLPHSPQTETRSH